MQIETTISFGFQLFDLNAVAFCIGVFSNAGQLPRNLHSGPAASNLEAVSIDLAGDINRREAADRGQLIAELAVERLEPIRQDYFGCALAIERDDAVVDVHHIGRFDDRVREVFVFGIERMVDLERAGGLRQEPCHVNPADEITGIAAGTVGSAKHTKIDAVRVGGIADDAPADWAAVDSFNAEGQAAGRIDLAKHTHASVAFTFTANPDVLAIGPKGYPQDANPFTTMAGSLHTDTFASR